MRLLTIVLVLCTTPLGATILIQDSGGGGGSNEQVKPDGISVPISTNGFWRTTGLAEINNNEATALLEVDEGYGGPYDSPAALACNDENVTPLTEELRFDFPAPSGGSPSATASAQSIRVVMTKTNATCNGYQSAQADPTFDIYVWDGDSLETLATGVTCNADTDEITPYSWTYEGGGDGSETYVIIEANGNGETGTSRRRCGIEAIDWYAGL